MVMNMTKEESVLRYLELAIEHLPYSASRYMKELDITDAAIEALRRERESALSMKATEKRDLVVKQVIKPLLKQYGFSTGGTDWRRQTEDAYIIIHMMNSQFNSIYTGVGFRFHISAVKKDAVKDKLSNQWIYNQDRELKQFDFLPYCGMLSPYHAGDMYRIDGYKNYLPSDTPVEDICRQIEEDFGEYILPELSRVLSCEDFMELRAQKLKRYEEKEIYVLRYFHVAQMEAPALTEDAAKVKWAERRKDWNLSKEDILSHIDWMDACRESSDFPAFDTKALVIKTLED